MESDRTRRRQAEYRTALSAGLLFSLAVHVLLVAVGGCFDSSSFDTPQTKFTLGYRGPTRQLNELEILEANSIQSYFSQRRREGRRQAPEYHVRHKLEPDPGPDAIPIRSQQEETPREVVLPALPADDVVLLQPVRPTHQSISFSECLVVHEAVKPDYPEYERSRRVEGRVLMAFQVTFAGTIQGEHMRNGSTSPAGESPSAFEFAALEAIRQWKPVWLCADVPPEGQWLEYEFVFDLSEAVR